MHYLAYQEHVHITYLAHASVNTRTRAHVRLHDAQEEEVEWWQKPQMYRFVEKLPPLRHVRHHMPLHKKVLDLQLRETGIWLAGIAIALIYRK